MAPAPVFDIPQRTFAAGQFISPTFTVPQGVSKVDIAFVIASPDISDPNKFLDVMLDRRDPNNSNNWIPDHGFTWKGSINVKTGLAESPRTSADVGPLAGQVCRIRLNVPNGLTAAVSVSAN